MVLHTSKITLGCPVLTGDRHSSLEKVRKEHDKEIKHLDRRLLTDSKAINRLKPLIFRFQSLDEISVGFRKQQRKRDICCEHRSSNFATGRQSYNRLWWTVAASSVGDLAKCMYH